MQRPPQVHFPVQGLSYRIQDGEFVIMPLKLIGFKISHQVLNQCFWVRL
jgi:hypothetical protein